MHPNAPKPCILDLMAFAAAAMCGCHGPFLSIPGGRLKVDNTTQPPTGMLPSQGRQLPVDNSEEVKCRRMALAVRGS